MNLSVGSSLPAAADRLLERGATWATAGVLLLAAVPALLGIASASYVLSAIPIIGFACLIRLTEPEPFRRAAWGAFALAFFCRFLVLTSLGLVQTRSEGAFVLGPDGIVFFRNSVILAGHVWSLPNPAVWGTYDIGQYYLFASLIHVFGADLFAIQLFNCGLSALVALLMTSAMRSIRPAYASIVGVLVALYPSSITIASFDLWKDPSVSFATALCVWGGLKLWYAGGAWSRFGFGAASTAGLTYLRCTRFYVVVYLELAVAALMALVFIRRVPFTTARLAVASFILVVFVAEGTTWYLGWPLSPKLLKSQIEYALQTRAILERTPRPHPVGRPNAESFGPSAVVFLPSPEDSLPGLDLGRGFTARVANTFRRLYGPYIWIWPSRWSARLLFQSDYLLYPGMVIWYTVLPFIVIGLVTSIAAVVADAEPDLALCGLAFFISGYFAQYLLMNLSYRQRDMMFPILAIFAVIGAARSVNVRWWRLAYAGYWAALAIVALAHLVIRARLSLG